jgi:hypothetical protein
MQTEESDIYTYLSRSNGFQNNTISEAKLAIVAGADTNSITVSNVCYLLCRHPEYQEELYDELKGLPTVDEGVIDDQNLIGNSYLTGIINEALRLRPPVPSGLQRLTPPEGAVIAGRYIPGNMNVSTPTYSLHRGQSLQPRVKTQNTKCLEILARSLSLMSSYPSAGSLNLNSSFAKMLSCLLAMELTTVLEGLWPCYS